MCHVLTLVKSLGLGVELFDLWATTDCVQMQAFPGNVSQPMEVAVSNKK